MPLPALSLRSPQSSAPQPPSSCSAKPPHHDSGPTARSGAAEACIGRVLWRVRSQSARTAAGRPWPQEWILRRPTTTILDPKSSSAASVLTDFAEQSPSPKARPVAVLPRPVPHHRVTAREGSGCRMFAGANASASSPPKQSAATCPEPQSTPSLGLSRAVFATAPPPSTAPPDKELLKVQALPRPETHEAFAS